MVQSQGPTSLTIGQLAAGGNVGVETIRFYQRKGLLETPARDGGVRRYGSQDLRRLRFIKQAQAAGFTLEEIKELMDLDAARIAPVHARSPRLASRFWMRKYRNSTAPATHWKSSRGNAGREAKVLAPF